jgi:hypothetical protein
MTARRLGVCYTTRLCSTSAIAPLHNGPIPRFIELALSDPDGGQEYRSGMPLWFASGTDADNRQVANATVRNASKRRRRQRVRSHWIRRTPKPTMASAARQRGYQRIALAGVRPSGLARASLNKHRRTIIDYARGGGQSGQRRALADKLRQREAPDPASRVIRL